MEPSPIGAERVQSVPLHDANPTAPVKFETMDELFDVSGRKARFRKTIVFKAEEASGSETHDNQSRHGVLLGAKGD